MTLEYQKRVKVALDETKKHLEKELGYSEDLRDKSRVNFLKSHTVKLNKMLKQPIGSELILSFK